MMFPLVQELADDRIAVAVTCPVLGFTKQGFYAWKKRGISHRDWDNAQLVNLIRQIHGDHSELGAERVWEELTLDRGVVVGLNRVERLMRENRIRSVIVRKTGSGTRAGPPVHDDLVRRDFTAAAPNILWLTDITEHPTGEGKPNMAAVLDVFSKRVVGYATGDRMTAPLPARALSQTVRDRKPEWTIVHSDRGSQAVFNRSADRSRAPRIDGTSRCSRRQRCYGVLLRPAAEERAQPTPLGHQGRTRGGHLPLDRDQISPKMEEESPRTTHALEFEKWLAEQAA